MPEPDGRSVRIEGHKRPQPLAPLCKFSGHSHALAVCVPMCCLRWRRLLHAEVFSECLEAPVWHS